MTFKDIVNRDIVNLENCEDEPIHIPGLIQPHGFLIAIDDKSLEIVACSENSDQFLDWGYKELLGKNIKDYFGKKFIDYLTEKKLFTNLKLDVFEYDIKGRHFAFSVHHNKSQIILEGEPTEIQHKNEFELYNSSKQLLSYIENTSTLAELCQSVSYAIKSITDYDRVMIYRFDKDYNGQVIAESCEEHIEPFLGLHYPHTDIPKQARELYIKNHLRIIGDVDYKPVSLYTLEQSSINQLDLSISVLRSVSPIHVQYLHNMGVGATLTISLMHKGKLWGLIACHHYSPKYLSQDVRNTVKLHGHFITSQIDVRILNEQYEIADKANKHVDNLSSKNLEFNRESLPYFFKDSSIIEMCNADGVALMLSGDFFNYGQTPIKEDVILLGDFLSHYSKNSCYKTDSLSRIAPDLKSISIRYPGINYFSLGNREDFLIWFRRPTMTTVNWAGDPKKSIEKNKDGLSPRKSFAKYTENVKDLSKPWLDVEITACMNFINYFQIHVRSILLNEEKENQRKLSEVLEATNAELENINWISTHDLQEPLRKIRMMASSLLREGTIELLDKKVQNRIMRMQNSAERMQNLLTDILKYTKTNFETSEFDNINLQQLLRETVDEIEDTVEDNNAKIIIGDLPLIKGISFLLKQLFLNMIYNSLKFKSENRNPVIEISHNTEEDSEINKYNAYKVIEVRDNGIGFKNDYSEKIFKIFSRLNSKDVYEGSGIGLALCKKIMIKHGGIIDAEGKLNEGATIKLYFPKSF